MIKTIKAFITERMKERSFWVGMSLAAAAAASLPWPFNLVSFIAGTIGSSIPDGKVA